MTEPATRQYAYGPLPASWEDDEPALRAHLTAEARYAGYDVADDAPITTNLRTEAIQVVPDGEEADPDWEPRTVLFAEITVIDRPLLWASGWATPTPVPATPRRR